MSNKKPRVAGKITKFTKKDISTLFKNSKTICRTSGLSLKANKINISNIDSVNNIGKILILIPKKVGNAPTRNKIRRQIKHIFYQEKIYEYNYNFIIYCNKDITNLSYASLKEILLNCLQKIV